MGILKLSGQEEVTCTLLLISNEYIVASVTITFLINEFKMWRHFIAVNIMYTVTPRFLILRGNLQFYDQKKYL